MIRTPEADKQDPANKSIGNGSEVSIQPEQKPIDDAARDDVCDNVYLIGRPTLKQFLRFARRETVDPPREATLIEIWQSAQEHVRELEKSDAGAADHPLITPIEVNGKYRPLLVEFLRDPLVQNGFNSVPTEVAFIDLDQLVVYQHHIDLAHVRQVQKSLGSAPTDEEIFRACLPYDHPQPPAKWSRMSEDSFVFVSPSNDIRFLGHMELGANNLADVPPPGALVGVVGLAIGFGSNFLNAFYAENRLILNNGSHRAYALREIGIKRVPCIVQHISTREKLDVVAASAVRRSPDHFLRGTRPSMLKDYFNPKLRVVMPVRRQLKQVIVKFEVKERYVPAL